MQQVLDLSTFIKLTISRKHTSPKSYEHQTWTVGSRRANIYNK